MIGIYHSRDLDGMCSGAIIKKRYPEATLIGFDYGQGLQKLLDLIPAKEPIIMADVSLPMVDMLLLSEHSGRQLTWIDHHASAIADYKSFFIQNDGLITSVLEDGIAACEGTWKYLFPDKDMPRAVELLGQYDTWRNQDKSKWDNEIIPFQFGMRMDINSAETFPQEMLTNKAPVDYIIEIGNVIIKYQSAQNSLAMHGSFVIDFEGLRVLACNGGGFNSQAFESKWDEEFHDAMMPFKFNGEKWTFSLYTTKDIDLSVIAKKYGGGGHKKACGFMMTELPTFLFKN